MDFKEKLREGFQTLNDYLNEQAWFQELRTKWQDLSPQNRTYVQFGIFSSSILFCVWFLLGSIWSVHQLKTELSEKKELLKTIQSANDELKRLKDSIPAAAQTQSEGASWSSYFETLGKNIGLGEEQIKISQERSGDKTDESKENLFDIQLTKINVKQLVRYTYSIEHGGRPAKVRHLIVDTKNDLSGYLDAQIFLSAFTRIGQ